MKRLLARVGLTVLAAALLPLTSTVVAHADPAYGGETRCGQEQRPAQNSWVLATPCTVYTWWNYGANWSYQSKVKIRNDETRAIYVTPYMDINGVHQPGTKVLIPANSQSEQYSPPAYDVPSNKYKQGRVIVDGAIWSKDMFAPYF
jgi:hypothetical protein